MINVPVRLLHVGSIVEIVHATGAGSIISALQVDVHELSVISLTVTICDPGITLLNTFEATNEPPFKLYS